MRKICDTCKEEFGPEGFFHGEYWNKYKFRCDKCRARDIVVIKKRNSKSQSKLNGGNK